MQKPRDFAEKIIWDRVVRCWCTIVFSHCRQVREMTEWIFSEPMLIYYITTFRDSWWPNGELATVPPSRSDEEKMKTRIMAKEKILQNIPGNVFHLLSSIYYTVLVHVLDCSDLHNLKLVENFLLFNSSAAEVNFILCIKKQKKYIKIILTLSCWYLLESSRWVLPDEYPFGISCWPN